jgi:preprotein translocase subunit SecA
MLNALVSKIIGTRNDRALKTYTKHVNKINALEEKYKAMDDEALKEAFSALRSSVQNDGVKLSEVLHDSFAITREASVRTLGLRHYDVQLVGGMVLHEGNIAEMKTGEGKTLVATLPTILNAILDSVHIVTVNDYLAQRDANEMRPLYEFLGFSVGILIDGIYDENVKREQYAANITYGTNNEYGFDYLRDNMAYSLEQKVQGNHAFVIVDEVDSILIDEARTPLIISGSVDRKVENYVELNAVALKLVKDEHFEVDEKNRAVLINEEGIAKAEEILEIDNLYDLVNATLAHHLDQALKANYLFEKDVDYVVNNGEVLIVDEFTGRISEGRRFSEGLHQALEAKEGVSIKEESQTLADITYQNYFRMYKKLAGMTGTAQTEATEFSEIYNLDVVSIPTNVAVARDDRNDLIYKTEREKFDAVIATVKQLYKKGQPVLIGTASIEKSETLHALLKKQKIPHTVLNAKQHDQEGEIIKKAGIKGAVTIATNMAGRGVDIKLGDGVKELGGLYILGTERHENRRIDNQLRGRSGRQGDPGVSQFYLSLEDNLLRIFGSEKIQMIMERLGIEEGEHIESKMVTRAVEKAQKKVENLHFEGRKHIVEYDDVANEQRKIIYTFRNQLLDKSFDVSQKVISVRQEYVASLVMNSGFYEGMPAEDFESELLIKQIAEEFRSTVTAEQLQDKEFDELVETIVAQLTDEYNNKMAMVPPEVIPDIEREFYLKTLDKAWREHLYQMDTLKTGIGLRGYNQKDPLVEYKKDSFNLFQDLIVTIKAETIKTLQIIQFKDEVSEEDVKAFEAQKTQKMQEANKNLTYGAPTEQSEQKFEKKPARNEPCPCGSGKKYKHCCGKSGPKKGNLA